MQTQIQTTGGNMETQLQTEIPPLQIAEGGPDLDGFFALSAFGRRILDENHEVGTSTVRM